MRHYLDVTLAKRKLLIVQNKFDKMYVTKDIYKIYGWLLEECGYPALPDVEYEKRKLEYEDVFPVLYLKYRLTGKAVHNHIKHLVIDEMQDYSRLQYLIIRRMFSCKMTILGDRAQTMADQQQDVLQFLPGIFGKDLRRIEMRKSYRNTVEIASYGGKSHWRDGSGAVLNGTECRCWNGMSRILRRLCGRQWIRCFQMRKRMRRQR